MPWYSVKNQYALHNTIWRTIVCHLELEWNECSKLLHRAFVSGPHQDHVGLRRDGHLNLSTLALKLAHDYLPLKLVGMIEESPNQACHWGGPSCSNEYKTRVFLEVCTDESGSIVFTSSGTDSLNDLHTVVDMNSACSRISTNIKGGNKSLKKRNEKKTLNKKKILKKKI